MDTFKRLATKAERLDPSVFEESYNTILEKLSLKNGEHLKRAAILLFHSEPDRYMTGATVKIGYFRSATDLQIEAWGRGTLDILEDCDKYGIPAPVFSYEMGGFGVEFKRGDGITDGIKTSNTSKVILEIIEANAHVTIVELARQTTKSDSTIERHLKKLQSENKIKRIGSRRTGYWMIVKE